MLLFFFFFVNTCVLMAIKYTKRNHESRLWRYTMTRDKFPQLKSKLKKPFIYLSIEGGFFFLLIAENF